VISYWLGIASSSAYATSEELLIWVPASSYGCGATYPWTGKGITMNATCFNEGTFPHEVGHFLGLVHTHEAVGGYPDPETGGVVQLEDSWDLIHGPAGPGVEPRLFASKSEALAFTGTKKLKNDYLDPNNNNCSIGAAPACSVSCWLWYEHFSLSRLLYTDGPSIDGSLRFVEDARGANVMGYFGNLSCTDNGITPSQAQQVRKYLKYDMIQPASLDGILFFGPTPWGGSGANHTYRDALGFRQTSPSYQSYLAYKLDFDGDGLRDIGVFKPPLNVGGVGSFHVLLSTTGWLSGGALQRSFGTLGDIPVPADYDGDGRTDVAVYRTSGPNGTDPTDNNGYWVYCPSNGSYTSCASPVTVSFGNREDVPMPGTDFDGFPWTGEMALFRPSADRVYWRIQPFTTNQYRDFADSSGGIAMAMQLDGDNKTDIARYRMSNASFDLRLSGSNWNSVVNRVFTGAARGSYPVRTLDHEKDVLSVYDPTTSTFRTMWTPLNSSTITTCAYGEAGDTPIATTFDFNADWKTELLLLKKPNAAGNLLFKMRNSGGCSGDSVVQTIGPASSNRVVLFMGQDMSGDTKPDLMMLDTQTMQWRFYSSQWNPATWTPSYISWGDARDVPL
jgi:hypothetical protein